MRNSPSHGPRNGSRGPGGHRRRRGRGAGRGRDHRRPEARGRGEWAQHAPRGRRQQRPERGHGQRRHRRPEARGGEWAHRAPRDRRQRRRQPQPGFGPHRPVGHLFRLHNEMGRVFDHMFAFRENQGKRRRSNWHPPVDFSETADRFELLVELPGVSQNDINVSVTDNRLTIKGKKRKGQNDDTQHLRQSERRYGKFHRTFPLPPKVVTEDIKAQFKDGVLTLTVPKTEEAKPTEIPIGVD